MSYDESAGPQLRVYDVEHMSSQEVDAFSAEFLCSFDFPPFSKWAIRHGIEVFIQTEPISSRTSRDPLNAPFCSSQNNKLLVITLAIHFTASRHVCVLFSVLLSTLLDKIDHTSGARHPFSWAEWGYHGTRMMVLPPSDVWVCYVQGTKFVILNDRDEVEMYDFNPFSLKHALQSEKEMEEEDPSGAVPAEEQEDSQCDDFSVEYLTGPENCDCKIFKGTRTTLLPCRKITTCLPRSEEERVAIMLTDDSLVIVVCLLFFFVKPCWLNCDLKEGSDSYLFRILTF